MLFIMRIFEELEEESDFFFFCKTIYPDVEGIDGHNFLCNLRKTAQFILMVLIPAWRCAHLTHGIMPTLPIGWGSVTEVGMLPSQSSLPYRPFHWLCLLAVLGRHQGIRSTICHDRSTASPELTSMTVITNLSHGYLEGRKQQVDKV